MKGYAPKTTETLDESLSPVSNKAVKDSMTKIFNGIYTTEKLRIDGDYSITIPLPTGWTKITGISAIIYPLSSWSALAYLAIPTYKDDGTVTYAIHTIGSVEQTYAISYTVLGN